MDTLTKLTKTDQKWYLISMIETVNKSLLVGDKFILKMYLRKLRFTSSAFGPFTKKIKKVWNLKKQGIEDIFIKINLGFNMTWHMDILGIYLAAGKSIAWSII